MTREQPRPRRRFENVPLGSLCAFGLEVESDFLLPGIVGSLARRPDQVVRLLLVSHAQLEERWTGSEGAAAWRTVAADGTCLQHEIGVGSDHLFTYGRARFHVAADGRSILCAVDDEEDPGWRRQLLDTILFATSFIRGFELLHASAIEFDGGAVAFVGASGCGKSSLAAEFLRRGRPLFCDDVLAVREDGGERLCHPGPPLMNLPRAAALPSACEPRVIAEFAADDELWLELGGVSQAPRPLAAVYVLDRGSGACGVSDVSAPTAIHLLRHAITLRHDSERARQRFDLFSLLAQETPMRRLHTGGVEPAALADLVETSMAAGETTPALATR